MMRKVYIISLPLYRIVVKQCHSSLFARPLRVSLPSQPRRVDNVGVSHSVSRENPNSNAVRGSSSSSIHSKLSSASSYLFLVLLLNILFMQCDFWFKLFELRRYLAKLAGAMAKPFQSIDEQRQPLQSPAQQPPLPPSPRALPLPAPPPPSPSSPTHRRTDANRFASGPAHSSTRYTASGATIFDANHLMMYSAERRCTGIAHFHLNSGPIGSV